MLFYKDVTNSINRAAGERCSYRKSLRGDTELISCFKVAALIQAKFISFWHHHLSPEPKGSKRSSPLHGNSTPAVFQVAPKGLFYWETGAVLHSSNSELWWEQDRWRGLSPNLSHKQFGNPYSVSEKERWRGPGGKCLPPHFFSFLIASIWSEEKVYDRCLPMFPIERLPGLVSAFDSQQITPGLFLSLFLSPSPSSCPYLGVAHSKCTIYSFI